MDLPCPPRRGWESGAQALFVEVQISLLQSVGGEEGMRGEEHTVSSRGWGGGRVADSSCLPSPASQGSAAHLTLQRWLCFPRGSSFLRTREFNIVCMKQQENHYPHLQINVSFLLGLSGRQNRRTLEDFSFLRNREKAKTDLSPWVGVGVNAFSAAT